MLRWWHDQTICQYQKESGYLFFSFFYLYFTVSCIFLFRIHSHKDHQDRIAIPLKCLHAIGNTRGWLYFVSPFFLRERSQKFSFPLLSAQASSTNVKGHSRKGFGLRKVCVVSLHGASHAWQSSPSFPLPPPGGCVVKGRTADVNNHLLALILYTFAMKGIFFFSWQSHKGQEGSKQSRSVYGKHYPCEVSINKYWPIMIIPSR